MCVHGIPATKVLSVAGASPGLVWTQEAMHTPEVAISVPLDLLRVRVPVQTGPHSAEESFFATEVGTCRGFVDMYLHGFIVNAESAIGWSGIQEKRNLSFNSSI